jgi:hypothetical protein
MNDPPPVARLILGVLLVSLVVILGACYILS